MKLSILIATTLERAESFAELYAHLVAQLNNEAEIIILADNKQLSVGRKRQRLLESAAGDYVVFIDDDDWVSDDYVNKILEAISSMPDCIGFLIDCDMSGVQKMAIASKRYTQWAENRDGFDYVRTIYHKTPVRRELALAAGFRDMRYGEDHDYAMRLLPLLKTEVFINEVMYYYRFKYENPQTKFGLKSYSEKTI